MPSSAEARRTTSSPASERAPSWGGFPESPWTFLPLSWRPSGTVGGLSRITLDIPPFVMAAERDEVAGLNLIGLRRRGVPREAIRELKEAFRLVYLRPGNIREIAAQALAAGAFKSAEARRFLEFITAGIRGIARARRLEPPSAAGED